MPTETGYYWAKWEEGRAWSDWQIVYVCWTSDGLKVQRIGWVECFELDYFRHWGKRLKDRE